VALTARDAHTDDDLRIPAHPLAEALVHPERAGKEREARPLIAALEILVEQVDEAAAVAAAKLRARTAVRCGRQMALVLAYADVRKAEACADR